MGEDWSRPAPPSRARQQRPPGEDEWGDPWEVRVLDESRLRSRWAWHPNDTSLGDRQRLWREGGLVTIADGEETVVEGTATGAAVVRDWAPVGLLLVLTAFMVALANLVGDDGVLLESLRGLLFSAPFVVNQLRTPFVRIDLLDHGGDPRTVHVKPEQSLFTRQVVPSRALARRLRADASASHPDAG